MSILEAPLQAGRQCHLRVLGGAQARRLRAGQGGRFEQGWSGQERSAARAPPRRLRRWHHMHSDTAADRHSPRDGIWHSHMGWLLDESLTNTRWGRVPGHASPHTPHTLARLPPRPALFSAPTRTSTHPICVVVFGRTALHAHPLLAVLSLGCTHVYLPPAPHMPFTGELRAHHVGGRLPQERADGVRSLLLLLSLVLLLLLLLCLLVFLSVVLLVLWDAACPCVECDPCVDCDVPCPATSVPLQ